MAKKPIVIDYETLKKHLEEIGISLWSEEPYHISRQIAEKLKGADVRVENAEGEMKKAIKAEQRVSSMCEMLREERDKYFHIFQTQLLGEENPKFAIGIDPAMPGMDATAFVKHFRR